MKPFLIVVAAIWMFAGGISVAADKPDSFRGTCMGTYYAVTIINRPPEQSLEALAEQVSEELERIEQIFSLYRPNSELSHANAALSVEWISVSNDLLAVAKRALQLAEETSGSFDPTVGPLIRLWRLHQATNSWFPPTPEALAKTKQRVGWKRIELREMPPGIRKLRPDVELDLNALVEGWAIDCVTELLKQHGIHNALIELGGEFGGIGHKMDGEAWRIGIENPQAIGDCYATVRLNDAALSTSGNYRQAIEHQGRRYGHVLDARSGEPVQNDLVAVSVFASDAMTADGWATALLTLGPVEGMALAERKGLAASFVIDRTVIDRTRVKQPNEKGQLQIILTTKARQRFELVSGGRSMQ